MLTDGYITEANKATLFTDAYTPTLTAYAALESLVDSEARSIDLLTGKGSRGGFSLKVTDFRNTTYMEGYFTRLFGSQRTTIGRTRLTAGVGKSSDFTADWDVSPDIGTNGLLGTWYCGLETVTGTPDHAGNQIDNVTRSVFRSPCISHKANSAGVYPEITDHPTVWRGRIVRLFVTFEAAGELAGGAASARSVAHQIVGVLERVQFDGEHWVIECASIDKLLDREACKGLPTARVQQTIVAEAGLMATTDNVNHDGTTAPVLHLIQWDIAASAEVLFDVYIAPDTYSVDAFIDAVNAAIPSALDYDGNSFVGQLSLSLAGDTLSVLYRSAAAGSERNMMVEFGHLTNTGSTADCWERIVVLPYETVDVTGDEALDVTADTNYEAHVDAVTVVTVNGHQRKTIALSGGPEDSPAVDFSTAYGDHNLVVIESSAGRQLASVESADTVANTITVFFREPDMLHEASAESPIRVTKVVHFSSFDDGVNGPLGSGVLRLLLSTGEAGFNDATYDTLPEGIGIEWPNETPTASADTTASLIDIASFERAFADAAVFCDRIVDYFWKPFRLKDWLESRLAFFGFYLTIENGTLRARQGMTILQHQIDATLTKSEMVEAALSFGEDAGIRGVRFVTGRTDFGGTEYTRTFLLGSKADLDLQLLELRDPGVVTDDARLLLLSQNVLVEYSKEAWRYVADVDRALLDVEPGMVASVSDVGASDDSSFAGRGLPNPDGTRGLNAVRMLVLSADTDWEDGIRTRIELLSSKTKRGGYSASAWVSSFTNVGNAVLTCLANFFSPTADGVDASRFSVGDKVRLLQVNSPLAGDAALPDADFGGQSGLTILTISGNTITLTGTIDADWVSGTDPMVLIHDKYETGSQTATAQAWSYIGDSSGDIDDGGDTCFEW